VPNPWPRRLIACSIALLVLWVVLTFVAVWRGWPAEVRGIGDPENVGDEWLSRGTLLSPPLLAMVAQAVLTIVALVERRPFLAFAGFGLAVIGAYYTIAAVGEPLHPERSDPPVGLLWVVKVLGVGGSLGLVVTGVETGVAALRRRIP
jgi:hypothetical protein